MGQYAIDAAATVGIDRLVMAVAQQAGKARYRAQQSAQIVRYREGRRRRDMATASNVSMMQQS